MRERPEQPISTPETRGVDAPFKPEIKFSRSLAKAVSWRTVGTIDTLILSYVLITFMGPLFGLENSHGEALESASYIAITEVITKSIAYIVHERLWVWIRWGTSVVNGKHKESYARSTTKTISWRAIGSIDTMVLAWFFTGNIGTAISIGGVEVFTKLLLYFIHERVWSHIGFGIVHHSPSGTPD